jgi:hypothetical protein
LHDAHFLAGQLLLRLKLLKVLLCSSLDAYHLEISFENIVCHVGCVIRVAPFPMISFFLGLIVKLLLSLVIKSQNIIGASGLQVTHEDTQRLAASEV